MSNNICDRCTSQGLGHVKCHGPWDHERAVSDRHCEGFLGKINSSKNLTKREHFAFEFAKEYIRSGNPYPDIMGLAVEQADELIKELKEEKKDDQD